MINCISSLSKGCQDLFRKCDYRHFSYQKELSRLVRNPNIRRRLDIIDSISKHNFLLSRLTRLDEPRKIAFGRSLEVFEELKNTHFIFHHGQHGLFLPFNILKTHWEFWPNPVTKFKWSVRHPANLQELDNNMLTVAWYKRRFLTYPYENDYDHQRALLSVDGYLASTRPGESALSVFCYNGYDRAYDRVKTQVLTEIVNYHIEDPKNRDQFFNKFQQLDEGLDREFGQDLIHGAILYTICIPKNNFLNCGYLSKPFGMPVKIDQREVLPLLEKMQNEEEIDKNFHQIRLLTHLLKANKALSFMFTTVSDDKLKKITTKVSEIIQSQFLWSSRQTVKRRADHG